MISKSTLVWLGLAGLASGVLFHTSYRVQALNEQLSGINRDIISEQDAIQVIKAEWSMLNEPHRIEETSRKYLMLAPTSADQLIASVDIIPQKLPSIGALVSAAPVPSRKPAFAAHRGVVLANYGVTR
jgi:hypothetical protein